MRSGETDPARRSGVGTPVAWSCETRHRPLLGPTTPGGSPRTSRSATRLLVLKADGSVLVHADTLSYKPLNWMSPPCVTTVLEPEPEQRDAGVTEIWKVAQAKTADLLVISIHEILHDSSHEARAGSRPAEGRRRGGPAERLLAEQIELLGEGHRLVRREYMTAIGPVDILATDANGGSCGSRDQAQGRHRRRRAAHAVPSNS